MFGGTSNAMDTLPLDRTGNRRFMPVMVYPERAECHILDNEASSREYIEQVWAEAMEIFRSGEFRLMLSKESAEYLKDYQKQRNEGRNPVFRAAEIGLKEETEFWK